MKLKNDKQQRVLQRNEQTCACSVRSNRSLVSPQNPEEEQAIDAFENKQIELSMGPLELSRRKCHPGLKLQTSEIMTVNTKFYVFCVFSARSLPNAGALTTKCGCV